MSRDPGQWWPPPAPNGGLDPGASVAAFDEDTDLPKHDTQLAGSGLYLPRYVPDAMDDSFPSGGLDAKWTKNNWSTTAETTGSDGGCLSMPMLASSGDNVRSISQPVSGDFDFCVWVHMVCDDNTAQWAALGLRESGTDKHTVLCLARRGGSPIYRIGCANYTDKTTFSADVGTSIDLGSYVGLQTLPLLFRVKRESTTLRFYVCFGFGGESGSGGGNRRGWIELNAPSNATFFTTAPDQVILAGNATNSHTPFIQFRNFRKR